MDKYSRSKRGRRGQGITMTNNQKRKAKLMASKSFVKRTRDIQIKKEKKAVGYTKDEDYPDLTDLTELLYFFHINPTPSDLRPILLRGNNLEIFTLSRAFLDTIFVSNKRDVILAKPHVYMKGILSLAMYKLGVNGITGPVKTLYLWMCV